MKRSILLAFVLLCGQASLVHAQILVASTNSPQRYKEKADFICTFPNAGEQLQAVVDLAQAETANTTWQIVDVAPGFYYFTEPIYIGYEFKGGKGGKWIPGKNQGCTLRGLGEAVFSWKGEHNPGQFIVHFAPRKVVSVPTITGIRFAANGKVSGLYLYRYGGEIRDLAFNGTAHYALFGDGVWWCRFENLHAYNCHGAVYVLSQFNGGTADMLRVYRCDGSQMPEKHQAAVYVTGGNSRLTSVLIEHCQYSVEGEYDYPAIRLTRMRGSIEGVRAEASADSPGRAKTANVLMKLDRCKDLKVSSIQSAIASNIALPNLLVSIEKSERCVVDGVWGNAYKDALVRVGPECVDCEVVAERVTYGAKAPRHIVDYVGRNEDN